MKIPPLHEWDLTPKDAATLQRKLARRIVRRRSKRIVETVAGADVAFAGGDAVAAVILYRLAPPLALGSSRTTSFPSPHRLAEIERRCASRPLRFPYVPGLLSFREGPAILAAFEELETFPDVVLFDGQGIAHPRCCGLACHLGLWLDLPTIGCAKSPLVGEHAAVGSSPGNLSPLVARRTGPFPRGEGPVVGAALRTRKGVKPIYVSIGHRIDLPSAVAIVMACLDGVRIPRPTREADRWVGKLTRG